ncbi:hypothetical protein BCR32DRAFT_294641 [Anaeromyces robustus]|uniref:At4g15545-like C-terminal domain-containing protein n=1 Tax=Anaeromyces robustus TaxID=1754192 RepID=A0A1Y1X113_9FUNG|nr:hypothetical protein BCR32DRAFT_294641 [Anaeromyces robustus]|eukprot:ORX79106.1 hypothetical protein BCR32DRAFT_294641 [Anaeromyces robustus]
MNTTSINLESEFENAVNAVRNAFNNKITEKDSEVILLRNELIQKQNEIKEYIQKISHLENYIYKCDRKMNEMAKIITKLSTFKKNVLQSFGEEDIEEYKNKLTSNNKENKQNLKEDNNIENDFLKQSEINSNNNNLNNNKGLLSSIKSNITSSSSTSTLLLNRYELDDFNDFNGKYFTKKESFKKSFNSPVPREREHPPETIDGRDFFKLARSKLSYDQFTSLLANVKAYNNKDQGKGKTLENIEVILGETHHDLYKQFEKLLRIY